MAASNAKLLERDDTHARDRAIMVSRHLRARGIVAVSYTHLTLPTILLV